jgi:hypothetical protein
MKVKADSNLKANLSLKDKVFLQELFEIIGKIDCGIHPGEILPRKNLHAAF